MKLNGMRYLLTVVVILLFTLALVADAYAQGRPDIVWTSTYSTGPAPAVHAVAYAPDGQTVLSGHGDDFTNLWGASDGTFVRNFKSRTYGCGPIHSVAYSPDGRIVAAANGCDTRLWNLSDGTLIRAMADTTGPNSFIAPSVIAFSPDGQYLVRSFRPDYRGQFFTVFRVADGSQVFNIAGDAGGVTFSPDSRLVAAVNGQGASVDLWSVPEGTLVRSIPAPDVHYPFAIAGKTLAFSPDGQLLAAVGGRAGAYTYDKTIQFFRVSDGALVRTLAGGGITNSMVFTPDGATLITAGYEAYAPDNSGYTGQVGAIRFWRVADGALLKSYDEETGDGVPSVDVSPDGRLFIYAHGPTLVQARMPVLQCTYSIAPASASYQKPGGSGVINISAPAGCGWTAKSRANWLQITSGASGSGDGSITYNVTADTNCDAESPDGYWKEGLLIVAEQTFVARQNECPVGPGHYRIYGQITDGGYCRTPIGGVTVTLSGYASASVQTNSNGEFSFDNLVGQQSYTVTASKDGYTFDPQSRTVDKLAYDYGMSFYATTNPYPSHSISGYARDLKGQPLAGVTLHLEGYPYPRQEYTDSTGRYTFTCLDYGGSYTVTPEYSGYTFVPLNRTFNNLTVNQTGADFTGVNTPLSISGRVLDESGAGLAGALVELQSPQQGMRLTALTDERGGYEFTGLSQNYDYSVQSSLSGYGFTPASQSLSNLSASQTANFTATPLTCTYTLSSTGQHFGGGSGSGFFSLRTTQGCYWRVRTSVDWINLYASDGYDSMTLSYYVDANPTHTPRSGSIDVGGQSFSITQDGAADSCQYTVTPLVTTFGPEGGQGSAQVSAGPGCEWTARSNDFWLVITSGGGGTGSGTANFTVAGNGGPNKSGTLIIAGQTITIQQQGNSGMVNDTDTNMGIDLLRDNPNEFVLQHTLDVNEFVLQHSSDFFEGHPSVDLF